MPEPHRSENIYEGLKGKALDAQVRRDALTHRNLMRAAKNRYAGEDNLKGFHEHPGEVVLGQPLIARDPVTGYNEVLPIPFVPAEAGEGEDAYLKSLEASFRYGEIVRAGKEGDYDAKTGNRLSRLSQAAQLQAQAETSDINLTSIGGDLYAEMVRRDTFMSCLPNQAGAEPKPVQGDRQDGYPDRFCVGGGRCHHFQLGGHLAEH